jgi:hypothetical protein
VIEKGVQAGETVVVDGQLRLVPGSRVDIKNISSESAKMPPGKPGKAGDKSGDKSGDSGKAPRTQARQEKQQ